jgi:hypothetical protein
MIGKQTPPTKSGRFVPTTAAKTPTCPKFKNPVETGDQTFTKTTRMKTLLISLLAFSLSTCLRANIVTLQVNSDPGAGTNIVMNSSVSIADNEVATVLARGDSSSSGGLATWVKNGMTNYFLLTTQTENISIPTSGMTPVVIAGPALIYISISPFAPSPVTAYCTLQIDPQAFPPGQTLAIPAGSGALISLEASADLRFWTNAAPGLYTNQLGNLFFRIRADRIP